jgi:uncharacterized protein (DUF433 family)
MLRTIASALGNPRSLLGRRRYVPLGVTLWYGTSMSDHFSLRLRPQVKSRLLGRATRLETQPRTLAQRYIEEGLRHDEHPLIHFLPSMVGRRAVVLGTGLDVWEVIATARDNDDDLAATASYLEIPIGLVEAAVGYYGEYRDEIDRQIADNEAEYERGYGASEAGRQALQA